MDLRYNPFLDPWAQSWHNGWGISGSQRVSINWLRSKQAPDRRKTAQGELVGWSSNSLKDSSFLRVPSLWVTWAYVKQEEITESLLINCAFFRKKWPLATAYIHLWSVESSRFNDPFERRFVLSPVWSSSFYMSYFFLPRFCIRPWEENDSDIWNETGLPNDNMEKACLATAKAC